MRLDKYLCYTVNQNNTSPKTDPLIRRCIAYQAPTLIGCRFLKIVRKIRSNFTAFSASLRLQQRSEIMYTSLRFVNKFFAFASLR
ncbi:protein of unknown function [Pararobbsia alpina]